jgi:hypothetical protein
VRQQREQSRWQNNRKWGKEEQLGGACCGAGGGKRRARVRSKRRGVVDATARHDVTSLGFPASVSIADRRARPGLGRQALPGGPSRARGCGWLTGLRSS